MDVSSKVSRARPQGVEHQDRFFAVLRRAAILVGLVVVALSGGVAMAAEELPNYRVVEVAANNIEIREYNSMLLAEVTVPGERQQAASDAFRILAGFIFGNNTSKSKVAMTAPISQSPATPSEASGASEKIAMTAPVSQTLDELPPNETAQENWRISFMMPSEYTLETLPVPNDPSIRIYETEKRRAVAIRFSGRNTDANMAQHRTLLDAYVKENGLAPRGEPTFAFYDAPYKPFFLRRNEVIYWLSQ